MKRTLRSLVAFFVLALFALSVGGSLSAQGSPSASEGALATYRNEAYSFTLQYPKDLVPAAGGDTWSLAASLNGGSPEGTPVVTIIVLSVDHDSTKPYPYPLFFSAWVSVGVSPDTVDCYKGLGPDALDTLPRDVTIGGLPFKVGTTSDAGMMKYQNFTTYRIIHNGACYSVEQVEYGSSYRDENTQEGLSAGQLAACYDEAGAIARSFRFTDAVAP